MLKKTKKPLLLTLLALFGATAIFGQTQVTGTVTDATTGETIPFVAVMLKGTSTGTVTSTEGTFSITVPSAESVLVFSFLGYETLELQADVSRPMTVRMRLSAAELEAVVVTGYQTISRERATGAFGTVRSETIERSLSSDVSTALLGTVAGMQGRENADGSIDFSIRGIGSLHADASPLIFVDGFPVDNGFRDINPNDVESVTVLKDAAAASIWGARSGNGVIVIVTKKGTSQQLKVDLNSSVRMGSKLDLSSVLTNASSKDQVDWEQWAWENNYILGRYNGTFSNITQSLSLATELLYARQNGKIDVDEMNAGLNKLRGINNREQIKEYLLRNPVWQQNNITIQGSSARSRHYMSVLQETQLGNVIANSTNRWRLNYNNQTKIFKWMEFNFATSIHYANANTSGPTIAEMGALSPYEMIVNPDGSYATQLRRNREQLATIPAGTLPYDDWSYNLLREVRAREFTNRDLNTRTTAGLTFRMLEGLSYTSSFMFEYNTNKADRLYYEDSYYVRDMVNWNVDYTQATHTVNAQFVPNGAILQPTTRWNENFMWRNQINFDRTLNNKHSVTALSGMEMSEYQMNSRQYAWSYSFNPASNTSSPLPFGGYAVTTAGADRRIVLRSITGGNVSRLPGATIGSGTTTYPEMTLFGYRNDRYVSVYGNFGYSYDGKYNLTGSIRSDASNLITDDPSLRWEPLWSLGGMWNMHREDFVRNISLINRLTTRLTYGYNGNVDKSTSPYTLLSRSASPSLTSGTFTQNIAQMGNPTLRWERTHTLNFGVDFAVLNNLLFCSIDVYNKQGDDIIGTISKPNVTGATTQRLNQAGIYNRGFEVELGVNKRITKDVGVTTKVTYAYNKNKITSLYGTVPFVWEMTQGKFVEGFPINAMWAYTYLGMEDGTPYVEGKDGEKVSMTDYSLYLDGLGLEVLRYMGPVIDPHTLGWSGTISAYGLNLSFLLTGKFGGHFRNPTFSYMPLMTDKNIVPIFIEDVLNGSDRVPGKPMPGDIMAYQWDVYASTLATMVEKSSFIKMKEITLDYNLPRQWTDAVGLGSVKCFAQVRDLGNLWVANSKGYDPEWMPGTFKPVTTFAFGLNINFK